jgi:2-hydroxy-3-keto-5-methylthiopentenyl-1-phosphate phosphatase
MTKTIIQCDFDGTVTEEDISFHILDRFAVQPWRPWLEKYKNGEITVGAFNTKVFSFVKEDEKTLCDYVLKVTKVRTGFKELVSFARKNKIEFVVTSNGLDFYINFILKGLGLNNIKVFAARSEFDPAGMRVKYVGPDGMEITEKFKETFTRLYIDSGYRVIYIGNGLSDLEPAKLAYRVFATQDLIDCCTTDRLNCVAFEDFNYVIKELSKI